MGYRPASPADLVLVIAVVIVAVVVVEIAVGKTKQMLTQTHPPIAPVISTVAYLHEITAV